MSRPATIRAFLLTLVGAAWALPLKRAVRLLLYALSVDEGSINAANDTSFGLSIVISYCFSLAVALTIAWILPGKRTWLLLLPLAATLLVAVDVIRIAPENVILIFPVMHPFRPADFSLLIAGIGALIVWRHRRHDRVEENCIEHHNSRNSRM